MLPRGNLHIRLSPSCYQPPDSLTRSLKLNVCGLLMLDLRIYALALSPFLYDEGFPRPIVQLLSSWVIRYVKKSLCTLLQKV